MATEEHKRLATIIKGCHDTLRQLSKLHGPQLAWTEHLKDTERLREYAEAMHQLASIWEVNCTRTDMLASSRVKWTIDYCSAYFFTERIYLAKRQREQRLKSWPAQHDNGNDDVDKCPEDYLDPVLDSIRVLDVGSCFNAFAAVPHFIVTAIDLCPAADSGVLRGDFLRIEVVDTATIEQEKAANGGPEVHRLPRGHFECVVFSLLLEYIPSAEQRLDCCRKAYDLLRPEGILIVITPDSQHVGKNAALMKNWRYTLGMHGFMRIRFDKMPHIACMAFRRTPDPRVARYWAQQHREDYMSETIEIPQDGR